MNKNIYIVDWGKVVRWMLPEPVQKVPMLQWVTALLMPTATLHQQFLSYKKAIDYELKITPQVCWLETLLNDRFAPVLGGIYITDGEGAEALYIYTDDELQPILLYRDSENLPVTLYTEGEIDGELANDFIINVPGGTEFSAIEMVNLTEKFCLPGMRFSINIY